MQSLNWKGGGGNETLQFYLLLQPFVWFCILVLASFVTCRTPGCNIRSAKHTTKYSASINKNVMLLWATFQV